MKEFLKANKGCVLAIALISPVVVVFFEYIFYYHIQYRTENVKCVYDIIGAGMQTCLYQMAVIFIPFTMVYFFKGCYRYGIIIRQTQLKQVWLKMCVKLTKIILAVSVYLTVLICLIPFCFTDVIWNWSAQTSYVYIYGGVDTVYHPSVILVAAGCFTAVFTALMIGQNLNGLILAYALYSLIMPGYPSSARGKYRKPVITTSSRRSSTNWCGYLSL